MHTLFTYIRLKPFKTCLENDVQQPDTALNFLMAYSYLILLFSVDMTNQIAYPKLEVKYFFRDSEKICPIGRNLKFDEMNRTLWGQ